MNFKTLKMLMCFYFLFNYHYLIWVNVSTECMYVHPGPALCPDILGQMML